MSKKQRPKGKRAFFIRRKSLADDSIFFHDQGRRVYFDKVVHAQPMLANIKPEQKPEIVCGPVQEGDVAWAEVLKDWLPETVTPAEYLATIEQTARDAHAGKDVTKRQARAFLNRQRIAAAGR